MVESIIWVLIYVCLIVAAIWLVIWVLNQLGVPLPQQVIKILWVVVALLILLMLWRLLGPLAGAHLPR